MRAQAERRTERRGKRLGQGVKVGGQDVGLAGAGINADAKFALAGVGGQRQQGKQREACQETSSLYVADRSGGDLTTTAVVATVWRPDANGYFGPCRDAQAGRTGLRCSDLQP